MNIKRKLKILLVFFVLSIAISIINVTYSRYIADANGDLEIQFARWQILLNTEDITSQSSNIMELTPVIDANENVSANKLAPTSKGYFDLEIDPSNVEVSYNLDIEISENTNLPDLKITKYKVLYEDDVESEVPEIELEDYSIRESHDFDPENKFKPFTMRIYFEWIDDEENETQDNNRDTEIVNELNFETKIELIISFQQKI